MRTILIHELGVPLGGDVITEVDDLPVITMDDLIVYMERNTIPGDSVVLGIIRDGQELSLTVTLGERPITIKLAFEKQKY